MKKKIYVTSLLISLSLNIFSTAYAKDISVKDESYFLNLNTQIDLLKNKSDIDDKLNLVQIYINNGQDQNAFITLMKLSTKNLISKNNSQVLENKKRLDFINLKTAEIYLRNYNLKLSQKFLNYIRKDSEYYNDSLSMLMKIYIMQKDKEKADKLILENPNNLVISGLFDYSAFKLDSKSAKEKFEKYIALINDKNILKASDKDAMYYLASILVDNHELKKAEEILQNIIKSDYYHSQSHSLLGYIQSIDKKQTAAGVDELRIALKTNPMEIRALTSFGNGVTDKTYAEIEKDNPNLQSSEYFFIENRDITNLINQNKIEEAKNKVNQVYLKYPKNIYSYITKANFFLNTGNYQEAINTYKKAREISPEYGLVNNGLSIAIKFLINSQEKKLKDFNLDLYDYSKLDIESLKKVFINYDNLPEKYKKVIFYSVYPVKQYLPILAASGSTHYIIPLYEKATDYKSGQEFKGQRSFDGRLWDDIRGRGGFNSATGIEDLESVINFDFNTLSHEFAHQIHGYAFNKEQKEKISELYEKAKKDSKFLDYYAGSNDFEYFAQGVEAYNSQQGKLTLKATAKNTIEFLKEKDKELYDFIDKIATNPVNNDNYSQAYLQSASDAYFKNDYTKAINDYEKAVSYSPADINNYLLLANVYYQAGEKEKSTETYKKVLLNDKKSYYAHFGLANNYLIEGNFNLAQDNFEKGFNLDKLSADSYAEAARLFLEKGDKTKSLEYIDKAFKIDTENALAYSIKALLFSEKFEIEEALKNIDKAIILDAGNSLYKVRKAYILAKSGGTIKAYSITDDLEKMYNNSLPVRYDYDDKKKSYNYYNIKDIPTKAEYYYTLAYLKEADKNYIEAVNNYIKSLKLIKDYYKPKRKLLELYNSKLIDNETKKKIKMFLKV